MFLRNWQPDAQGMIGPAVGTFGPGACSTKHFLLGIALCCRMLIENFHDPMVQRGCNMRTLFEGWFVAVP